MYIENLEYDYLSYYIRTFMYKISSKYFFEQRNLENFESLIVLAVGKYFILLPTVHSWVTVAESDHCE